jgi:hypothetical protein
MRRRETRHGEDVLRNIEADVAYRSSSAPRLCHRLGENSVDL